MKKNLQEAYRKFIKKFYTEHLQENATSCILFTEYLEKRHDKFTKNYMRLYRKDIDIITRMLYIVSLQKIIKGVYGKVIKNYSFL